jgi:hypothetical protein
VGNTFTYEADLTPTGVMAAGDGFTIFDFALPTGATIDLSPYSPFWQYSTQPVGSPVSGGVAGVGASLSPGGDDASVDNVSFVWSGPTVMGTDPALLISPIVGVFHVTTNAPFTDSDLAVSHDSSVGATATAFGPVPVASVAPLPATANMGLALIACLGGFGAWRKMKTGQEVA